MSATKTLTSTAAAEPVTVARQAVPAAAEMAGEAAGAIGTVGAAGAIKKGLVALQTVLFVSAFVFQFVMGILFISILGYIYLTR